MWLDANLFFILAVSVGSSVDNFGVATAYALLGRSITFGRKLFIGGVAGVFSLSGSAIAMFSTHFVPKSISASVSGVIFIGIGLWAAIDLLREVRVATHRNASKPIRAGSPVGFMETLALSIGLSLNAGAAGLATGLAHRPVVATALGIAGCSVASMLIPQWTLRRLPPIASPIVTQAVGAIALITIGILQFP